MSATPRWDDLRRRHPDAPDGEHGYGALARLEVPPRLSGLWPALEDFGLETQPHEAKPLRKQIGRVRDFLDIFVFAYDPDEGEAPGIFDEDDDPWQIIREQLDHGYETLGAYKDLYDAQGVPTPEQADYDPHEVASLRYGVLAWTTHVLAPARRVAFSAYVERPSLNELHDRRKRHQPRFFWREADLEPRDRLSGLANVARLLRALIAASRDDLDTMRSLKKLHRVERQEPFHDFRKRLRTVEKLGTYFPEVMEPGSDEHLALVVETVDRYGDLNDRLVAHARAVDRGKRDKAERLADEIADDWGKLRKWQRNAEIDDVLKALRRSVFRP